MFFNFRMRIGEDSEGVGALTAEDRDTWAAARAELESVSEENRDSLLLVDSSLFAVNIDLDWAMNPEDLRTANKNTVVGPDPANRWFDKSVRYFCTNRNVFPKIFFHFL